MTDPSCDPVRPARWWLPVATALAFLAALLVAPGFSVAPASIGFGDQQVGTTSDPRTVTVTNTGPLPLTSAADAGVLAGADAAQFSIAVNTCSGQTLVPAGTCTVLVRSAPTSKGARAAHLAFTDDAMDSPQKVGLSVTGTTDPTPVPGKPGQVKASASTKKVTGTWKAVTGASGYKAKLTGKDRKNKKVTKTKTTTTTSVKFKIKLKPKSTYKLCVTAQNSGGSSPTSCKKGKVGK